MVQTAQEVNTCPPEHRHADSQLCYKTHGCRCRDCTDWQRDYQYHWRHMKAAGRPRPGDLLPARGLRRRIEAMMTLGYSKKWIADRLGFTSDTVRRWCESEHVFRRTHGRVDALYRVVENTPRAGATPEERQSIARSRNTAARLGYHPPAAWDDIDADPYPPGQEPEDYIDESAVHLALMGEKPPLSRLERAEVVRVLHPRKWSDPRIGSFLGCSTSAVLNARKDLGLPAWPHHELQWEWEKAA